MPKRITKRQTTRPAPYNLRASATTSAMTTAIAAPMGHWPQAHHHHQHSLSWSDQMGYQYSPPQHMPPTYMPSLPHPAPPAQMPQPQPGQSAPWSADEDSILMDAKSQGLGWNEIHQRHFPLKSGNACRKRHERLMQKLRTTNWDDGRIRKVMHAYNNPGIREQFWTDLANRVGEDRWEEVERVCFQQGLKNLRTSSSSHSRGRSRASSGHVDHDYASSQGDYDAKVYEAHDDSGFDEALGNPGPSRRSSHAHSLSVPHTSSHALPAVGALVGQHYPPHAASYHR